MEHFTVFQNTVGELIGKWRWQLLDFTGKVIMVNEASFSSREDAVRNIRMVQQIVPSAYIEGEN